jgi:hypothetical protein
MIPIFEIWISKGHTILSLSDSKFCSKLKPFEVIVGFVDEVDVCLIIRVFESNFVSNVLAGYAFFEDICDKAYATYVWVGLICYLEKDFLNQSRESCSISRHFQRGGDVLQLHNPTVLCTLLKIIQIGWNSIQMLEKKFQRIFLLKRAKGQNDCLCRSWPWKKLICKKIYDRIPCHSKNTTIRWISKCQKSAETSTYVSELVVSRIATELILEVR